jgi:TRAP-type C4-dicarboxylate transport system permease small subunit
MNEESAVQNQMSNIATQDQMESGGKNLKPYEKRIYSLRMLRVVSITLLVIFIVELLVASFEWWAETSSSTEPTRSLQTEKSSPTDSSKNLQTDLAICSQQIAKLPEGKHCSLGYFLPLKVVSYTAQSSIILMTVVFLYLSAYAQIRWKAKKLEKPASSTNSTEKVYYEHFAVFLAEVFIGSLSISAFPTGISLIICGIYGGKPMQLMSGMEIYIAFAGISLAALAFLGALQEQGEIQKGKDIQQTAEHPAKFQHDVSGTDTTFPTNDFQPALEPQI